MFYLLILACIGDYSIAPIEANYEIAPITTTPIKSSITNSKVCYFFTQNGCPPCETWLNVEAPKLKLRGYITSDVGLVHIAIVDINKYPKLARQYQVNSTPTFVNSETGKRIVGYADSDQIIKLHSDKSLTQSNIRSTRSGPTHYRWTWPGMTERTLRLHLRVDHGFNPDGRSYQDIINHHDALHGN